MNEKVICKFSIVFYYFSHGTRLLCTTLHCSIFFAIIAHSGSVLISSLFVWWFGETTVLSCNKLYFIRREVKVEIILYTASSGFHQTRSLLAHFVLSDFWYTAKLCTRCVAFYNNHMVQAIGHFPRRPFNICFIKMASNFFSGPQMRETIKWDSKSHVLLFDKVHFPCIYLL